MGARDDLTALETRFRWVVDNLHDIVATLDAEGRVLYQSPSIERHLGYTVADLEGRDAFDHVHPDDLPELRAAFVRALLNPGETIRHEYRYRHKDGSWRHLETAGINLLEVEHVRAILVISRDVTARRKAAEALRSSEQRFHGAFDHATVGMAILSPLGRVLEANRALCDMLGRSPSELRHAALASLSPPADQAAHQALYDRFLAGEIDTAQKETRFVRPSGAVVWTETSISLQRDPSGAPLHLVAVVQDITARRVAAETEQRLAAIVQSSHDAIMAITIDGTITNWNPAAERLFGYHADEMLGEQIGRLVPEDLRESDEARLAQLRLGRSFRDVPTEAMTKDGRRLPIMLSLFPIRDVTGAISGICGVARAAVQ